MATGGMAASLRVNLLFNDLAQRPTTTNAVRALQTGAT